MFPTESQLNHWISSFYGYGSWKAPIWLISYEEPGGDLPEEVAEKLDYFSRSHSADPNTLSDIREMYRHCTAHIEGTKAGMFANLYEHRFGDRALQNSVWKNLIAFVHGFSGEKLPDPLLYQRNSLASPDSREALITFYPLPSPHDHAWYYAWLDMPGLPFLKRRALYEDHLYESRMATILHNIGTYKPRLVMMFGMNNINRLKKSVQASFPDARFRMIQAIKLQIPQHHRADFNGTTFLITSQMPALRHNRVETGFDWQQFGELARAPSHIPK